MPRDLGLERAVVLQQRGAERLLGQRWGPVAELGQQRLGQGLGLGMVSVRVVQVGQDPAGREKRGWQLKG